MNINTTYPNESSGSGFYCGYCRQWVTAPHSHTYEPPVYYNPTPQITNNFYVDDETKQLLKKIIELLEKVLESE